MTAQSEDKAFLRRRAKEYRKSLLPEEKARRDKFVTDNLFALDEFKNAKTVLCYVSSSREVDTSCIIKQAVLSGKIVAVPMAPRRSSSRKPPRRPHSPLKPWT